MIAVKDRLYRARKQLRERLLSVYPEMDGAARSPRKRRGIENSPIRRSADPVQAVGFDPGAKRAIDLAWEESEAMASSHIGTEHLLLGILREGYYRGGILLRKLGADLERARAEAATLRGG